MCVYERMELPCQSVSEVCGGVCEKERERYIRAPSKREIAG